MKGSYLNRIIRISKQKLPSFEIAIQIQQSTEIKLNKMEQNTTDKNCNSSLTIS